ncbi:MAG: hypothetical protein WKF37_15340 [Bryobacteraceae bacterium]
MNRSLAWVVAHRLGISGSIVANHDDHAFLLSMSPKHSPTQEQLHGRSTPFNSAKIWKTRSNRPEMLGRSFRPVAEIGQLLPRRTFRGPTAAKSSSWNGSLLYTTLKKHEPSHPLLRETIRGVVEDLMDVNRAQLEAERIFKSEWRYSI